jgi:hypothetical protein
MLIRYHFGPLLLWRLSFLPPHLSLLWMALFGPHWGKRSKGQKPKLSFGAVSHGTRTYYRVSCNYVVLFCTSQEVPWHSSQKHLAKAYTPNNHLFNIARTSSSGGKIVLVVSIKVQLQRPSTGLSVTIRLNSCESITISVIYFSTMPHTVVSCFILICMLECQGEGQAFCASTPGNCVVTGCAAFRPCKSVLDTY